MITILKPIHKWLCFCLIAIIVILGIKTQNANTKPRVSEVTGSDDTNSDIPPAEEDRNVQDVVRPAYFVESAKCKIPYVDPFASDAMAIFHPEHFETCSNETALVTPIYDISRQRYVLFINESLASIILNSNGGEYNCYYQEITRDRKHDSYDK